MEPIDQAAGRIRVRDYDAATKDGTNQYALVPGAILLEEFATLDALKAGRAGRGLPIGIVVAYEAERAELGQLLAPTPLDLLRRIVAAAERVGCPIDLCQLVVEARELLARSSS